MTMLVLGLALFIGAHTIKIWGSGLRQALIDRIGEGPFKGAYSLMSLAGMILIVNGYQSTRLDPVVVYVLPTPVRHTASLLVLVAFILLAAAYAPPSRIKAWTRHPMMLGTGLWAFAHLLANGLLGEIVLFGGFLVWIAVGLPAAWARDSAPPVPAHPWGDLTAVGVGLSAWLVFAFYLHAYLFGVAPFG